MINFSIKMDTDDLAFCILNYVLQRILSPRDVADATITDWIKMTCSMSVQYWRCEPPSCHRHKIKKCNTSYDIPRTWHRSLYVRYNTEPHQWQSWIGHCSAGFRTCQTTYVQLGESNHSYIWHIWSKKGKPVTCHCVFWKNMGFRQALIWLIWFVQDSHVIDIQ